MFSQPVIGKDFFGRDEVLSTLAKRVCALKAGYRQNVALTGQMLSGKSSILHHFLHSLKDTSIIPVYVEVADEPFRKFADKFIATLLYNYLKSEGRAVKKELGFLAAAAEPLIPRTISAVRHIEKLLATKHYNAAYRELLDLTSVFKEETKKPCVVILDEFNNMEKFRIKNPYLHFGKIIMIQKGTMYIVSSSQKSTIRKILSEKLALLFGNFEIIEVSGFDPKTARAFLEEKLSPYVATGACKDYLVDFAEGNPFYLDLICKRIKGLMRDTSQEEANPAFIEEALDGLIFNTNGTINQYLSNNLNYILEKRGRDPYIDVLVALANGNRKLKDIDAFLKKKDKGLSRKLAKLAEMDFVYKNGAFYYLCDRVFEFWLKNVYHKRRTVLIDNVVDSANEFRAAVRADIAAFMEEYKKPPSERIRELFGAFNEELVEIDKKVRRLPAFVKIEVLRYKDGCDLISCEKEDKYWVFQIKEKRIEEADIADFLEASAQLKDRLRQKVMVALDGVEQGALLLAKEKRIWLWDLANVNKLLRLYRKNCLVR